jgi:histidinol-phosphatase
MPAVADDLALALELADLADEITIGRFRAADLAVETKPDLTPVTEADRAAEQVLRARLAVARPADGVVGEEFGDAASEGGEASRRWIIDPIDGTKNYVRGIPVWATLIALEVGQQIVLGVVSAPALHRRWWASRGEGAWLDDRLPGAPRRMRVSGVRELADSQLSYGALDEWEAAALLDKLLALGGCCWRTRGFGDFWSYMLVAEGGLEIGLDPVAAIWDLAAMMVIVEEAGGRFTDFGGVPHAEGGSGLATNGLVHDAALAIVGT